MSQMPIHTVETGINGNFRFRRQPLTGLAVLQVEINLRTFRQPSLHSPGIDRSSTGWRDATMEEAYSIQMKSAQPKSPDKND